MDLPKSQDFSSVAQPTLEYLQGADFLNNMPNGQKMTEMIMVTDALIWEMVGI